MAPAAAPAAATSTLLRPPVVVRSLTVQLGSMAAAGNESASQPLLLTATNGCQDHRGQPVAELTCVRGSECVWTDYVAGHAVALAGSNRFSAAALSNGDLLVFSPAGRRLLPALRLGGLAAFLAMDGAWLLLALSIDGSLRLWDMQRCECLVEASVAPLAMASAEGV